MHTDKHNFYTVTVISIGTYMIGDMHCLLSKYLYIYL